MWWDLERFGFNRTREFNWQTHSRWSGASSKMASFCFSSAACWRRRLCLSVSRGLTGCGGESVHSKSTSIAQCLHVALQRALLEDAARAAERQSAGWAHRGLAASLKNWCGLGPQCCFVASISASDAVILLHGAGFIIIQMAVKLRSDNTRQSSSREVWSGLKLQEDQRMWRNALTGEDMKGDVCCTELYCCCCLHSQS